MPAMESGDDSSGQPPTEILSKEQVDKAGTLLNDSRVPMKARFRALFMLRNEAGDVSVRWIAKCFGDTSALLKHELAYCLGQMGNASAVPILMAVLKNENEDSMVRHEAGEALGALAGMESLPLLETLQRHQIPEIAQTCQLAVQRIKWINEEGGGHVSSQRYQSVDPVPAIVNEDIEELRRILVDSVNRTLWERYEAMFALRNIGTNEAVVALADGLFCEDSALFRHEIAYVLGQYNVMQPLIS